MEAWTPLSQPFFDMGRNRANLRLSDAQKEEMVLEYLQAVQQGFREVLDALVAVTRTLEYRERQEALRRAAGQAAELSTVRYQGGATSYVEVLRSETDLFDTELNSPRLSRRNGSLSSRFITPSLAAGSSNSRPVTRVTVLVKCSGGTVS